MYVKNYVHSCQIVLKYSVEKVNLLDSTTKTLVFLRIIILQRNLELHSFSKFTLFVL
jgi:hypothetical protein